MHTGLSAFPIHETALLDGSALQFRQASGTGSGAIILLHGIGSNSGSWLPQLQHGLNAGRVLAWNAPGYGDSTPVAPARPAAQDYATRLWQWLDALGINSVHLVGHSLGAIMAARATVLLPTRVQSLTLLSPAQGYATAIEHDREAKRSDRIGNLHALGVQGLADKRGAAMLSPDADASTVAYAKYLMTQINVAGYTQAVHLLMDSDIGTDLQTLQALAFGLSLSKPTSQASSPSTSSGQTVVNMNRVRIACGVEDTITPPAGCAALAARFNISYTAIAGAGHAVAIDAPSAVSTFLSL